ncbi:hypothetical protein KCU64_g68, partial [Aureobasidium melanogenum]
LYQTIHLNRSDRGIGISRRGPLGVLNYDLLQSRIFQSENFQQLRKSLSHNFGLSVRSRVCIVYDFRSLLVILWSSEVLSHSRKVVSTATNIVRLLWLDE